jgi:adenylate cyclase class 2
MHPDTDHLEIEVKFFLDDPHPLHQRLIEMGARPGPRVFETNIRYENTRHSLKSEGVLLRLRQDQVCRLTVKSRSPLRDAEFKIHTELEVEVSDFGTMAAILSQLGFHAAQTYEKWRQTFGLDQCVLCMDAMPYGHFLEIEGSRQAIRAAAERLGLPWRTRILNNYLAMFEALREKAGLAFNDLTFANFAGLPVSIAPYISRFYAG